MQHLGDHIAFQSIGQQAAAAVAHNIARSAIVGRDEGQAAGGRFDQGQPERFGQRRIDEYLESVTIADLANQSEATGSDYCI